MTLALISGIVSSLAADGVAKAAKADKAEKKAADKKSEKKAAKKDKSDKDARADKEARAPKVTPAIVRKAAPPAPAAPVVVRKRTER